MNRHSNQNEGIRVVEEFVCQAIDPSMLVSKEGSAMIWGTEEIATNDADRAQALEAAPSPDEIAAAISAAFSSQLNGGNVRFGLEEAEANADHLRAVLQFHVGEVLFDRFFNARTGYRAQFRLSWQAGLDYNHAIIAALRDHVSALPDPQVRVRRLIASFEVLNSMDTTTERLVESLAPCLSKIWFCTLRIDGDRVVTLPAGVTGPRILLEGGLRWAAPYRDDANAWLVVKGAFVSAEGPYQPKDPVVRAKKLQSTGEA